MIILSVSLNRILLAVVFIVSQIIPTFAETGGKRMALVIGNANYEYVSNLPNAENDAIDISAALKRVGFEVISGFDLDYQELRLTLRDFAEAAEVAEKTIIYFAGHGIEIGGLNYLIPVDARLRSDRDVEYEAIQLDALLSAVASTDGLKMILLDACRNNPFLSNMVRTSAKRSIGRGLGKIEPGGVLVGYAARSGTLALDGDGRNSPYSTALLQHIEEPGLEVGKMFRKVRDTVYDLTNGYQEPFTYGSLPGADVFLVPPLPSEPKQLTAAEAWQGFRSSSSSEALEAFAAQYEGTAYAAVALSTAKKLRERVTASDAIQLPIETALVAVPNNAGVEVASVPENSAENPKDLRNDRLKLIQISLREKGCYFGSIDGLWGRGSTSALSRFNSSSGAGAYFDDNSSPSSLEEVFKTIKNSDALCVQPQAPVASNNTPTRDPDPSLIKKPNEVNRVEEPKSKFYSAWHVRQAVREGTVPYGLANKCATLWRQSGDEGLASHRTCKQLLN